MDLVDKVDRTLRELGVADGDRVGVACSGGADSVALVHLLARSGIELELAILHVNHGLRPSATADADFVAGVAGRLEVDCRILAVDVDRHSRLGLEAAARDARYSALQEAAKDFGLAWVATAHTLDDQAETVLLRTIRGGSLGGISPINGIFVRPLLSVERVELRDWLSREGIDWRDDPTNEDLHIERNWIRAVVVPLLRERRPGVDKVLARLASSSRDDAEALDALASEVVARAEIDDAGLLLRSADVAPLPRGIATRVIRSALRTMGVDPHWNDLDAVHRLPYGGHVRCGHLTVWRLSEGLALLTDPPPAPGALALPNGGTVDAPSWGVRVRLGPPSAPAWRWRSPVPSGGGLLLRSREAGDRVPTTSGTKKVQDVLVDAKVPRPLRDLVPIVAVEGRALAVVGLTSTPGPAPLVIDAEPSHPSWSKSAAWTRIT